MKVSVNALIAMMICCWAVMCAVCEACRVLGTESIPNINKTDNSVRA